MSDHHFELVLHGVMVDAGTYCYAFSISKESLEEYLPKYWQFGDPSLVRNGYTGFDLPFEWIAQFGYFAGRNSRGFFQGSINIYRIDELLPGFTESASPIENWAWFRKQDNMYVCMSPCHAS